MGGEITVRDVPEDVREALMEEARRQGRSLQGLLLAVPVREAAFSGNRRLLADIERELAEGGGAGPDAPDSAELIRAERPDDPGEGGTGPVG
ncbi:FitA-like ribbon-helix-helix domain-containing protein [Nocardiopsis suaedae]|uniref:Antitoxin FitA-like ribbon-helix-helix domain-containing protein n=1 Tax=Nocardiopsis suaedae TaxID=3018444 RepID=A0ABT4TSN0_9ACTN|nr:hypothetical protein [Nocardiopsis suaedae]MDA2807667.1 hypothetical protein [Nocardiopsis suaedae]